ncbi:MAG: polyprenyl synthetase family protein [Parachlamydiaceae bacterium]|nr:polyprenyl synthetase family protein [Parachlamydiaceae bacterium]
MTAPLKQILENYRLSIDDLILKTIPQLGKKSKLRDACEYALLNGGKRFRPALVLMVANTLKNTLDLSSAALAIEYFHTASLIADDLPCMDNDDERRNQPSLHIAFNESTALMASYALISAGYTNLSKNAELLAKSSLPHALKAYEICMLAVENVSYNTGLFGASGGQFLDLDPPNLSLETLYEIAKKKTASLFEISFVLGWLYGGGDLTKLQLVKKTAYHYGMAFQIADDIQDMQQDLLRGCAINIAIVIGEESAKELVHKEMKSYAKLLKKLDLNSPELLALMQLT